MCDFAFTSCIAVFPGGDWFSLTLRGYCALTRFFLCDVGL